MNDFVLKPSQNFVLVTFFKTLGTNPITGNFNFHSFNRTLAKGPGVYVWVTANFWAKIYDCFCLCSVSGVQVTRAADARILPCSARSRED